MLSGHTIFSYVIRPIEGSVFVIVFALLFLPLLIYSGRRLYQEKDYPNRTLATNITNPDFTKIAEAYGAKGFKINKNDDIEGVLEKAITIDGPVLIEVKSSLEYLAAYVNMSEIRKTHE